MQFKAFGHKNILGNHQNSLEITKDKEVTKKGDCIIGVDSDFELDVIKKEIVGKKNFVLKMEVDGLVEEVKGLVNAGFCDSKEIVIRRTEYLSDRTLGVRADKTCSGINREFVLKMQNPNAVMNIELRFY